jgi:hypothetical protein
MRCLDDDVVRDATIEQMRCFRRVRSERSGDYISEPTKLNPVSVSELVSSDSMGTSVVQAVQLRSSIV